jgi:hypothetical protein
MQIQKYLSATRTDSRVLTTKLQRGAEYGALAGLTFAIAMWGYDGYLLQQAHALFPWLKLIVGSLLSPIAGGIVGYLAIRLQNSIASFFLWLLAAAAFALLTVLVPLNVAPAISRILEPDLKVLLHYGIISDFMLRVGVAYAWIVIFTSIAGVLEYPLVDASVFSYSVLGRFIPFLLCLVIMILAGGIADGLNNEPLRSALFSMNSTIQFVSDHQGQQVDPKLIRLYHTASLRNVQDLITPERHLVIGSYDELFEQVHVLVKFRSHWVDCLVFYGQPSLCQQITP